MSLNDVETLEQELRQFGVEYNDLDYNRKLRQANNRLSTLVGTQFVELFTVQFEDVQEQDLDFQNLESFDKVIDASNNEVIDDSNYSVDLTTGKVTFDQSFVDDELYEGLTLKFYYVPSLFKDLELYIAVRNIMETEVVSTGTEEIQGTQTNRLNDRISGIVNDINSRSSTGVQHGDNTNRGSQPPRTLGD